MSKVKIESSYSSIESSSIKHIEERISGCLPDDYKEFLIAHNGGEPELDIFTFLRDEVPELGIVAAFLGQQEDEDETILEYLDCYENRIPKNLLPIAYDPGSNVICLSVSGEDYGSVYFWLHEFETDEDEAPDYSNVFPIKPSFSEFIDSLEEDKDA